jgi:hypothetical protein
MAGEAKNCLTELCIGESQKQAADGMRLTESKTLRDATKLAGAGYPGIDQPFSMEAERRLNLFMANGLRLNTQQKLCGVN